MDLYRRTVRGELSEIFGPTTLGEDKRRRAFGFARVLDENVAHLQPDLSITVLCEGRDALDPAASGPRFRRALAQSRKPGAACPRPGSSAKDF